MYAHGMRDYGINEPFLVTDFAGGRYFIVFWNNLLRLIQYGLSSWESFFAILSHYIKILPFRRIERK